MAKVESPPQGPIPGRRKLGIDRQGNPRLSGIPHGDVIPELGSKSISSPKRTGSYRQDDRR